MRPSMQTLIGIDPDFRIHVSDRLLEIHDGPFLELGLKTIVGQVIRLPRPGEDRPDRICCICQVVHC
jgi:putative restriction endonuclease